MLAGNLLSLKKKASQMSSRKIKNKTHKPKLRGPRSGVRTKIIDRSGRFEKQKRADEAVKELMRLGKLSADDIYNAVKLGKVARGVFGVSQKQLTDALLRVIKGDR